MHEGATAVPPAAPNAYRSNITPQRQGQVLGLRMRCGGTQRAVARAGYRPPAFRCRAAKLLQFEAAMLRATRFLTRD
jgi:hypothetical protein